MAEKNTQRSKSHSYPLKIKYKKVSILDAFIRQRWSGHQRRFNLAWEQRHPDQVDKRKNVFAYRKQLPSKIGKTFFNFFNTTIFS